METLPWPILINIFSKNFKARGSIVARHLSIHEADIDPSALFEDDSQSKPLMSVLMDMLDIKVNNCVHAGYQGTPLGSWTAVARAK